MVTQREWLIEQQLASPGRGRFSGIAKEALRRARLDGMVFDEDSPKSKTSAKPAASKKTPLTAEPVRSSPTEPARLQEQMYGVDESGIIIAFGECAAGHSVKNCECDNGPLLPKWMGGGVGLLEKPA